MIAVPYVPSAPDTPYDRLGGEAPVRALVERFYDAMTELEPALARLHPCDSEGRVLREPRDRFALFLMGWLGGPQDYVAQNGHPRLRMRHARVPVDETMVAAWMRCMRLALQGCIIGDDVRSFLEERLLDVAVHMRNR